MKRLRQSLIKLHFSKNDAWEKLKFFSSYHPCVRNDWSKSPIVDHGLFDGRPIFFSTSGNCFSMKCSHELSIPFSAPISAVIPPPFHRSGGGFGTGVSSESKIKISSFHYFNEYIEIFLSFFPLILAKFFKS